jgi:hypothetical protein
MMIVTNQNSSKVENASEMGRFFCKNLIVYNTDLDECFKFKIFSNYQLPFKPSFSAILYFSKSKLYKSGALCAPPFLDSSNFVKIS